VGSAWKIPPVTARSLWSWSVTEVLGGGGKVSNGQITNIDSI